mmetsp:Transcript_19663/g.45863  ORF Transcript_19663/g.45863 Transcript_19663/m.45863 type:complete len:269 (-) Transcript_19663:763-1569(-)
MRSLPMKTSASSTRSMICAAPPPRAIFPFTSRDWWVDKFSRTRPAASCRRRRCRTANSSRSSISQYFSPSEMILRPRASLHARIRCAFGSSFVKFASALQPFVYSSRSSRCSFMPCRMDGSAYLASLRLRSSVLASVFDGSERLRSKPREEDTTTGLSAKPSIASKTSSSVRLALPLAVRTSEVDSSAWHALSIRSSSSGKASIAWRTASSASVISSSSSRPATPVAARPGVVFFASSLLSSYQRRPAPVVVVSRRASIASLRRSFDR